MEQCNVHSIARAIEHPVQKKISDIQTRWRLEGATPDYLLSKQVLAGIVRQLVVLGRAQW